MPIACTRGIQNGVSMFSLAILYLSFGLVAGFPAGENRSARDSTHQVAPAPAAQTRALQVDARTIAVLQLRRRSRAKMPPYPRNLDGHEGYTPALEERIVMMGPVVPRQEKHASPAAPQNL